MVKKAYCLFAAFLVLSLASLSLAQSDLSFVFTDSPQKIEVVVGSSTQLNVNVKNIGDLDNFVELSVETTAPVSVSVVPGLRSIEKGASGTFSLSFLSSPTNVVNSYQSFLRLKGDNGVDVKREFSLVILPTPEKKFEINNEYLASLNKFEGLSKRFDEVKNSGCVLVSPGDVSSITPKQIIASLQDAGDTLEKTRIAIKEDDFVIANVNGEKAKELISKVDSEINVLRASQKACEDEKARISGYVAGTAVSTTVALVVIAVVVALLVYRHYSNLPKVRKLLPSGDIKIKAKSEEAPARPDPYQGMNKLGNRKDFQYEFKKKGK